MTTPNPIIKFSFDTYTSGTTVQNEGTLGSSLDATLYNNALVSTASPAIGTKCLSLTAANSQYMSTSNPITLSGTDWAVCFWYKKDSSTVSETGVRVFDISTALDTTTSEIIVGFNNSGSLYLSIGGGTSQTLCSTSCCDGTWRHVAVVYNSTTSQYSFYFNGIMCTSSVPASSIGTIGSNISRAYFYIGKSILTTGNIYATIQIDDFRIYDNVLLTVTDIALVCGNCHYYNYQTSTSSYVLINSILNSYLPNTTKATTTGFYTRLGNQDVDLNTLYARYSSGIPVPLNFTIGFSPICITGCCNYFSADCNITASNNLVSIWGDLSGNINNAVQYNSIYQPTYRSTDSNMNNMPSVYFNGANGIIMTCPSFGNGSYITYFIVMYIITKSTSSVWLATDGVYTTGCFHNYRDSGNNLLFIKPYNSMTTTINTPQNYIPFILSVTVDASTASSTKVNVYLNGLNAASSNVTIPSSVLNIGTMDIGGWSGNNTNTFYGGISSLIIYNSVLTTSQRQNVEGYLAWKWWGSGSAVLNGTINHPYYYNPIGDIGTFFNSNTVS